MIKARVFICYMIVSYCLISSFSWGAEAREMVFIDPFFGGKDSGPVFAEKKAKDLTLDMAIELQKLLATKGVLATLSRDSDLYLAAEEKVTASKMIESNVYIVIKINKSKHERINLFYPKLTNLPSDAGEKSLNNILDNAIKQTKQKESLRLTKIVAANIENASLLLHIDVKPTENFILENANTPSFILDFEMTTNSAFIFDKTMQGKVLNAVSEGIYRYLSDVKQ